LPGTKIPEVQERTPLEGARLLRWAFGPFQEVLIGVALFIAASLSLWMTRAPNGIALFWSGSAIAAAWLIRAPKVRWPMAVASVLLALILSNVLVAHRPWAVSAIISSVSGAEIALMVVVFRFALRFPYPNISIGQAGMMTALFGLVIPGLSGLAAGVVLHDQFALSFSEGALQWSSSHAIGACLLAPPIILFSVQELERLTRKRFLLENAAIFLAGCAACYLAIRYVRFPFVVIGLLLMVASFRLGAFGTSLLSLAYGLLITNLWLIGIRPLGLDPGATMSASLIGLPVIALLATVMPPIAVGLGSDARRAAVRALRASEQQYRLVGQRLSLVTDNFPGLIAQVDCDLRYLLVNRRYADWFDVEPSTLLGKSLREFYGESVYAGIEPSVQRALSGALVIAEREIVARGIVRHCQFAVIPQKDDTGAVIGLFIINTDISERRQAELALRESQSFLSRTGAVAGVGGWELNLRSGKLTWSDETRRLHEVDTDFEPTVENGLGFYTQHSRGILQQAVNAAIEHGTPWDLELELKSAKGRLFWARATGNVEFENGRPVRLVGAFQDVTEKRRLLRELADSYELLRVTLDSIGDAVITTDPQGRVQWLNPVAESMTGWTKTEAHNQPLTHVFNIVHAESRQTNLNPVAICLAEGRTVGLQSHTTLISRDGTEYGIEDSTSPIRNADGQILGAVLVFHDVTEQRRQSREMNHRATHDSLTGLVNRAEFEARLSRVLSKLTLESTAHVLMFIDLDAFKVVNDTCGHSAGDQLLRQLSTLLQSCVRGRDTVARLGGDEFGVLMENCGIEQGQLTAQKICDQMETYRFIHDGRRFRIGTSIGLVPVDLRWGSSAALMQAADSCCYAAKENGRNRVHLWVESDSTQQVRRGETLWVNRLEAALNDNQFVLHAQQIEPIAGPAERLHCEVLLRLQDDDGSLILPAAFLPSAERFHLATRIDRWVLKRVFAHLEDPDTSIDDLQTVSVNLSAQSVGDRAFHRELLRMLHAAPFDVRKLCLEITETAAIANLGDAKVLIDEVRALGVQIALDDFGAGTSSFGYLRALPVDHLKIDGQFISRLLDDPLDNTAVRCCCEVAKVVGVKTIAKFVERTEIRDALRAMGIDMAQGDLIHRAEPLAQLLPRKRMAMSRA
jgi:diguanylate cyclase (GGDEF)-like protein/PAS domain S-box-containing protein